jgi:L-fuculokinase
VEKKKKVTAVFDIGKTNKKFFLFDAKFRQLYKSYTRFEEIADEDGYPADNLPAIESWIKSLFSEILASKQYDVQAINFSTYGASFVHLDRQGRPIGPLYNYTNPYPKDVLTSFFNKYGDPAAFAAETASPEAGMLSSGLQLYWLKHTRPEFFKKIRWSLHFPQYLSYLFTGLPVSDYTSLGCHTGLWNYGQRDYHDWVYAEGIDKILPPLISTKASINIDYEGKRIRIGVGIHDSSAAMLPYMRAKQEAFLLVSTGTWSVSLNPFHDGILTVDDMRNNCLNYMRIDGKPVMASRLFLGNEYKLQVKELSTHFNIPYGYHRDLAFDEAIFLKLRKDPKTRFCFQTINKDRPQPDTTLLDAFDSFDEAYHQLMIELVDLQLDSIKKAIGNTPIKKIYIDGGFTDNDIFIKLLSTYLQGYKVRTTQSPLGSALGAAMVISNKKIGAKFLSKHYSLKKHESLIFST